METEDRISVVIPTKNEASALEECLQAISSQSVSPFEVIIVDGGSTDSTLNIATKFNATVVQEGTISSPANARNLGARNATGDILLMMDADIVPEKDCLKYALETFKDKNVIAVLPREVNLDHSYLEFIQRKWNEGSRTSMNIGLQGAETSGGIAFYRREVFKKVQYDTAYGFGEDDDFTARIKREFKGYKTVVAENCKVISHSPHTFRELASRYMWWGRTFFSYLANHFGLKSLLNLGSLLLPIAVVITLFLWMAFAPLLLLLTSLIFLFVAQILIACVRSRSVLFFQFAIFDLARSLFFTVGLFQSPFVSRKGR